MPRLQHNRAPVGAGGQGVAAAQHRGVERPQLESAVGEGHRLRLLAHALRHHPPPRHVDRESPRVQSAAEYGGEEPGVNCRRVAGPGGQQQRDGAAVPEVAPVRRPGCDPRPHIPTLHTLDDPLLILPSPKPDQQIEWVCGRSCRPRQLGLEAEQREGLPVLLLERPLEHGVEGAARRRALDEVHRVAEVARARAEVMQASICKQPTAMSDECTGRQ